MKRNNTNKLMQKLVSIYPVHLQIIDHFINDGRATSDSDVVRQALIFFHDKTYPNYIFKLSPAGKLKEKVLAKEEAFQSLPDEQYATETLNAVIIKNDAGKDYVMLRQLGNSAVAVPLEEIKEWAEKNQDMVSFHLQENKSKGPIDPSKFGSNTRGEFYAKHNITLPQREP